MRRLTLGTAPSQPAVEVELWERVFVARPMSRSLTIQVEELEQAVREASTADEAVERLGDLIDALLEPTGNQRKSAKSLIVDKWQADKLTVQQLVDFSDQLQGRSAPPS